MRQQGFTLLEVMVALAILAITLVIIFSQQATSINWGNEARIITKATFMAQERMTGVLVQDRLPIGDEEGEVQEAIPPLKWKTMVEESATEGMNKVTVLVLWKEGDRERDLRMVTYVVAQE
jgi:general secretion pathway protein I